MRTSNKIVLGIFIIPLVVLTLLQLALYAKYKSGHYISMQHVVADRFSHHPLNNVHHIVLYNLDNVRLVPANTARLDIEKDDQSRLQYSIHGDSLIIKADSTLRPALPKEDNDRNGQEIAIYLPGSVDIAADNSALSLAGAEDSLRANTYRVILNRSASLKTASPSVDLSKPVYFTGLHIKAFESQAIELTPACRIALLDLDMKAAAFTDNGALIDLLTVHADQASTLTLTGANLQRLAHIK